MSKRSLISLSLCLSLSLCRSVPANASDALYCMLLAQNAVHGAMAGYTGFSVGLVVRFYH